MVTRLEWPPRAHPRGQATGREHPSRQRLWGCPTKESRAGWEQLGLLQLPHRDAVRWRCPCGACTPSPKEGSESWSEPAREAATITNADCRGTRREVHPSPALSPNPSSERGEKDQMTMTLSLSLALSAGFKPREERE